MIYLWYVPIYCKYKLCNGDFMFYYIMQLYINYQIAETIEPIQKISKNLCDIIELGP